MNTVAKLGLAAALLFGGSAIANAEDPVAPKAGAEAGMSTSVDATTTGSLGKNYGSVISSLQSSAEVDLSAFNESATVNCIGVSTLKGNATSNAAALDNALTKNEANVTSLRADIQANAALMTKLQSSCSGIAGFDVNKIISVESGADGSWTFYVDDRAS